MTRYEVQNEWCICMTCAMATHLPISCYCSGPSGLYGDERMQKEAICPRTKRHNCYYKNDTCEYWRKK